MRKQILDSKRLPWPAPWASLFGREAPLWMEIGFGNGQFMLALARAHAGANVIGVEISQPSLRKAVRKAARHELENLVLVQGAAQDVLWALFSPRTLERVYVNFPDPWPKAAHHHRRLVDDRFLRLLATRMSAGACLDIATDHQGYAAWIETHLARTPYFASRFGGPYLTADETRLRTKYEHIALEEGRTCHYFKWRRNERPAEHEFPIPTELPMPHVIVHSPLTLAQIRDLFAPFSETRAGIAVRYIGLYEAADYNTLLVDTHVEEEPFSQRVALTLRARGDVEEAAGQYEWIVGLHEMGFPRVTTGIHRAVYHLARWLAQQGDGTRIVRSNLNLEEIE